VVLISLIFMNNRDPNGFTVFDLSKSSFEEYLGKEKGVCNVDKILELFKDQKDFLNT